MDCVHLVQAGMPHKEEFVGRMQWGAQVGVGTLEIGTKDAGCKF